MDAVSDWTHRQESIAGHLILLERIAVALEELVELQKTEPIEVKVPRHFHPSVLAPPEMETKEEEE